MSIRVELVDPARTTELRRAVLRPQWDVGTPMPGDDLPDALHVTALGRRRDGSRRVRPRRADYPHRDEPDAWQLRGMATAEDRRSTGIGALVAAGAVAAVTGRGGRLLWCKARVVAVAFYERHGFTVDTDPYVEPETGLPHRDMFRRL